MKGWSPDIYHNLYAEKHSDNDRSPLATDAQFCPLKKKEDTETKCSISSATTRHSDKSAQQQIHFL